MKKIILASHNKGKLVEISALMKPYGFEMGSCSDLGVDDIPETGETFAENAKQKTDFMANISPMSYIFADDSGFCVDALGGKPGVYSARYAPNRDFDKAMDMILEEVRDVPEKKRTASFISVIALYVPNDKTYLFEGKIEGKVIFEKRGTMGFGYDAIFMPDGYDKTFAEMSKEEKSAISHRGIALEKMIGFLENEKR